MSFEGHTIVFSQNQNKSELIFKSEGQNCFSCVQVERVQIWNIFSKAKIRPNEESLKIWKEIMTSFLTAVLETTFTPPAPEIALSNKPNKIFPNTLPTTYRLTAFGS